MSEISLAGKVVIITGASSGIGRAAAMAFAEAGACPVLVARRREVLESVQQALPGGSSSLVIPADITRSEDLQQVVAGTQARFGRIDVLVNNAGLSLGGPLQEMDPQAMHQMLEVNIYAPLRLAQLALPVLLGQGSGQIVNVSSVAGVLNSPGYTAYAASRAAVIAFSKALRRELVGTGVKVSVVLPGWTRTPMSGRIPEQALRHARLLSPLATFDEPEVPARAILDCVRYGRSWVALGGLQYRLGMLAERWAPWLMDWVYRWYFDRDEMVRVLKDSGV